MGMKRKRTVGARHLNPHHIHDTDCSEKDWFCYGEVPATQVCQSEVRLRYRQDSASARSKGKVERLPGIPPAGTSLRLHRCSALPVFL